ncbi:MAG: hypothetical protein R3183_03640 [Oleiphilaceae bacterium]|nr:hypothetical protein [Oleiphilaceae bacterium]
MAAMSQHTIASSGRTYGGLSPQERKRQRQEQFLQAGIELFGTIGFRQTTVRSLCKQAKLTDRYFYECCGSLEKLLMDVYEHLMVHLTKQVLTTMRENYDGNHPINAMRAGLDCYFELLEEPRMARICMVELEGISPAVDQLYHAYIRSFGRIFNSLADRAFPNWKADQQQREVLGISLVGALRQSTTHWLMNEYRTPRAVMVEASITLFKGLMTVIETAQNDY